MNWPMGGCPDDDFGRVIGCGSVVPRPHGDAGCWERPSLPLPAGAVMVGAIKEDRFSRTALLRFDSGALPFSCVYFAFCVAIAAAASGNMAWMVDGSRPELRLLPGDGGGRPREFRDPSTLNLFIASLNRFDSGSMRNVSVTER